MKTKKIKQEIDSNYNKISKKLKESSLSKDKSEELAFHLLEIRTSFDEIIDNIDNILKAKNKKEILDELDSIQNEFEFHIVNNHIIPAKNILNKVLF